MFAGPGIDPQEVSRAVGPEDIASTIAAFIGIDPPSGSVGEPLGEALPTAGPNKKAATAQ
jgi:hypothetical protein